MSRLPSVGEPFTFKFARMPAVVTESVEEAGLWILG